eukprot:928487-Prymnesium_polylepis.1
MSSLSSLPRTASNRNVRASTLAVAYLHCDASPLEPDALQASTPPDATTRRVPMVPMPEAEAMRYQKLMRPIWPERAQAAPL